MTEIGFRKWCLVGVKTNIPFLLRKTDTNLQTGWGDGPSLWLSRGVGEMGGVLVKDLLPCCSTRAQKAPGSLNFGNIHGIVRRTKLVGFLLSPTFRGNVPYSLSSTQNVLGHVET